MRPGIRWQDRMICRHGRRFLIGSVNMRRRFICLGPRLTRLEFTFPPETRNLYADEFLASYRGILILLMQKHLEFQIVTPRTLTEFQGKTLVLPDVHVLGQSEKTWLKGFAAAKKLVVTGTDA